MNNFKPINECKGFNMDRVLLKNKDGHMITAYYKDGMFKCDGDDKWTSPLMWIEFIRLKDLTDSTDSFDIISNISDTLLLKAGEYEDKANDDMDTEGIQHNLNIGRYDGLMQAIKELNKYLP